MGRPVNENVKKITDIYRAVVADSGADPIQIREAIHLVAEQIQPLIEAGDIVPDTYSWVKSIVMSADKRDGNATDQALAAIAAGQDDLSLDVPAYLDQVVILGAGRRKVYRYLIAADLDEMDELRHRNVRSVNRSYHRDWKPLYESWRLILLRNPTMADAVAAGDLPGKDAALFDGAA